MRINSPYGFFGQPSFFGCDLLNGCLIAPASRRDCSVATAARMTIGSMLQQSIELTGTNARAQAGNMIPNELFNQRHFGPRNDVLPPHQLIAIKLAEIIDTERDGFRAERRKPLHYVR